MNWLFFALLAPACYAVTNFIDKYILTREIKDYNSLPIYTTIMGILFGTAYWIISGFPMMNFQDTMIVLTTGVLTVWALVLYFKALTMEETSFVIILFQSIPIFVLILSIVLLRDPITLKQFLGFVLILIATIGISLRKDKKKTKLSSSFWLITLVNIMWAISAILITFAMQANTFSKVLSYESWGIGIGGVALFIFVPKIRKAFLKSLTEIRKQAIGIILINEFIFVLAKALTFYAYSLGPVALVSVLGGTNLFYGILYGAILTLLFPRVFKENITKEGLVKKIVFASLLFVGIVVMQ